MQQLAAKVRAGPHDIFVSVCDDDDKRCRLGPFANTGITIIGNCYRRLKAAAPAAFEVGARQFELVGNMRKHVKDLDVLVARATNQCKKMLGTSFDELHTLFKERFIDDNGKMIADSEHSEEKTDEILPVQ